MMAHKSEYQTRQGDNLLHYRLTSEEWLRACRELRPSEKDVLYYLRTLDPFGDKAIEIKVREMAKSLGVNPSTVSRALKALDAKGWIDLEVMSAKVKLHTSHVVEKVLPSCNSVAPAQHVAEDSVEKPLSQGNTVAPEQQMLSQGNNSDREATLWGQNGMPVESLNAFQGEGFDGYEFSTECTRSVLNSFKQQTDTSTCRSVEIDREELGTLLGRIEDAGVPMNAALAATLTSIYQADPEAATLRVRNALSSLQEQEHVRNPQAFLNAALKRGFTANQAKRRSSNREQQTEEINVPPVRDLSLVLLQIGMECERLGLNRDEAVQRFSESYGWEPKQFADLNGDDMEMLLAAMMQWS